VQTFDILLGYQKFYDQNHVKLYFGYEYQDHDLNAIDANNRAIGGKEGAKTQLEFAVNLLDDVSLENISSYSSAFNSYYIKTDLLC
jgi:hypothetical protein